MAAGAPHSGVGRVIGGRYLLLNRLGSGGMGHVWLAHDQRLVCEVALKEIVFRNPAEAGEERSARVARARAEARHAAGLRGHPHVVTVHDVLEHEGLPWIVMEYVSGALDLRDLVARRGPLAPAEAARIGLAVLDALTAGHDRGIMHRDVKPANILLAPDRTGAPYARVLLTDYGISVQPDAGETRYTLQSVLVGTAGYLAPERATGGPPTPAADLFSLGCTLYFAVEGIGAFERDSDLAGVTAVVLDEPRPMLRAGALEPLLQAMLTKDPVRRISAAETAAALAQIITPQTHPRTQVDIGSEPPWASGNPPAGQPGHGYGSAPSEHGFPRPWPGPQSPGHPQTQPPTATAHGAPVRPLGNGAPGGEPVPPGQGDRASGGSGPDEARWGTAAGHHGGPAARPGEGHATGRGPGAWPGDGDPYGPGGSPQGPVHSSSPGSRRRQRPRVLHALLGGFLGTLLALGGVWYAMANRVQDDSGLPYGSAVGLAEPLKNGDCVIADWPERPFRGTPKLTVDPTCRDRSPDGQVMAVVESASAEQARTQAPAQCEERTEEVRRMLADVRGYALLPTEDGFEAAGRRTPCLLLGAHGPVFGPLGEHREPGMAFDDTANMQKQDCLDRRSARSALLVSCEGRHDQRVLNFIRLSPGTSPDQARRTSLDACERDVPPSQYGYDPNSYESAFWLSGYWEAGPHFVVCTVKRQDGAAMDKDEP
ncbi:serine/threonine-protein kinase [Streptomyces cavernae]|uniref:serine/threonine-protein kinase n=1 Tax=Streptomyces cavernae TaxID=2259034 RepID=UPI001EE482CD|nr:serine/threonine-protein kinase [Streptomyces cavernae]